MSGNRNLPPLLDIQLRLHSLLRRPEATGFPDQIRLVESQIVEHLDKNSDHVLLTLVDLASVEIDQYSSTHALLVAALAHLGGLQIVDWNDETRAALRLAALTMNISMTELQDQLSLQTSALTVEQKAQIASHPERSEELLKSLGCTDAAWLEAVRRHHDAEPGPLLERELPSQLARMIQRADVFASRISPRKSRVALSSSAAAQFAYLDEKHNPDQAGAALIKAVGIYPPGSWVGLANGELGMALKRGEKAHCPIVAALIGPDGMPLARPRLRDTNSHICEVAAGIPPDKIKYRPQLDVLLRLL